MDPAVGGLSGGSLGALGPLLYGMMSGETGRGARAGGRALLEGMAGGAAGLAAGATIGRATGANALSQVLLNRGLTGLGASLGSAHGAYKSLKNTSGKKDEKKEEPKKEEPKKDEKKQTKKKAAGMSDEDSMILAEVARRRGQKKWHGFAFVKNRDEVDDKEWNEAKAGIKKKASLSLFFADRMAKAADSREPQAIGRGALEGGVAGAAGLFGGRAAFKHFRNNSPEFQARLAEAETQEFGKALKTTQDYAAKHQIPMQPDEFKHLNSRGILGEVNPMYEAIRQRVRALPGGAAHFEELRTPAVMARGAIRNLKYPWLVAGAAGLGGLGALHGYSASKRNTAPWYEKLLSR